MKKSKILAVMFALMLIVTGCGEKANKSEDLVAKANEKMKGLENYHISMMLDMTYTEGKETTSTTLNVEQDYDMKNTRAYMFSSSSMMGENFDSETYTEMTDGKTTSYTSSDGENWIKNVTEEQALEPNGDFDVIAKVKDLKVEKEEEGKTFYTATLDKETTKELLVSMGIEEEAAVIPETAIRFSIDKDGYFTHYEVSIPLTVQGQTTMIHLTTDFSQFNTIGDIIIPQEIIDNAEEF